MDCFNLLVRIALLFCAAYYGLRCYVHSRRRRHPLNNVPGPRSPSFIRGHMGRFLGPESVAFQFDVVNSFSSGVVRLHGMFGRPVLYVYDPKALHTVLIKEEDSFEQSARLMKMSRALTGPGMGSTLDGHHRKQRKLLTPVFTANRMRSLLPICYNIGFAASDAMAAQLANGPQQLDVLSWTTRIALESIGQGGLGHSFDPLEDGMRCEFCQLVKKIFPAVARLDLWMIAFPIIRRLPAGVRRLLSPFSAVKAGHDLGLVMDAVMQHGTSITEAKKRALKEGDPGVAEQIARGNDFMSLLIKANMAASEEDRLPQEEVIAQMAVLMVTATDTTSNTLARILELLAAHPDAQQRLRAEAISAWDDGDIAYGRLMQLPYLDAVFRETMRLYPPATWVVRDVKEDTVLPLSTPMVGNDGTVLDEVPVPRGSEVIIGILGANASKSIWGEDAQEWKPERWLKPLPPAIARNTFPGVSPNLMSFSGGRRGCIGWRFAEMEIKAMLSILLSRFAFAPGDKQVVWRAAYAAYPTVGEDTATPQLPLKVGLYNAAALVP